jgi:putative phage-type endonuclease
VQIIADTKGMEHEEWLNLRTKGIGGSDAATLLGINKYKTPYELWLEKTGEVLPQSATSEAAYFGNELEELVAKEFQKRTGKKVRKVNKMFAHTEHNFIIGNIDRKIVGENALLECKTANQYLLKNWEGEEIPESYIVQVQHYLAVTGYEKAYIAVLVGGQRFLWKEIERDQELIDIIIGREVHFWNYHVLQKIAPELDGSSAAEKYLNERFKVSDNEKAVDLSSEEHALIERLNALEEGKKDFEYQITEIKNKLKFALQDASQGYIKNYVVNWKTIKSNRIDSKRLKKEMPDLYSQYTNESVSRRFEIKEVK